MAEAGRQLVSTEDRYERHECIGRGSYGDVYRGVDVETGQQVAIKVIDLEDIEDDIEDIHKEIATLAGCKSANITEYYSSVLRPGSTELLIIMELLACSIADLLAHGPLDEPCIAFILREVLVALDYLHGEQRIHRDIKAANILLSESGAVKISDFGVSGQLTGTMGFRRRTFVGTPYWMAPEVIESSEEGYTQRADIWSLGITAIEMALCSPPHADTHPMRVLFIIPKDPAPSLTGPFSEPFKSFVATCLQKDQNARPSAKELLAHPFVAGASSNSAQVLSSMAMEHAKRKRPLPPNRGNSPDEYAAGTLPMWDFGTKKGLKGTGTLTGTGTLRAGDALKPTVLERYMQGTNSTPGSTGSSGSGVMSSAGVAGVGGTMARADGRNMQAAMEMPADAGRTLTPAEAQAARQRAAAAAAGLPPMPSQQQQQQQAAAASGVAYGGTVRAAPGEGYGTMVVKPGDTIKGAAPPSPERRSSGGGARSVYERMPSLKQLQVDVGGAAGTGAEAGGGAGKVQRQDTVTAAVAAESGAVLGSLLVPALRAAALDSDAVQETVDAVALSLAQLEQRGPGACAQLLTEALLQLSISEAPALQKLKAAAGGMFGGAASLAPVVPQQQGQQQQQQGQQQQQKSGGSASGLGALGSYLLAKWREDCAREAAAAARQMV